MTDSRKERNSSDISVDSLSLNLPPDTAGQQNIVSAESTGNVSIPANCLWVKIRNAGFVRDGDIEGNITVNGSSWSVGRDEHFEQKRDSVNRVLDLLPAFEIVSTGSRVFYSYATT